MKLTEHQINMAALAVFNNLSYENTKKLFQDDRETKQWVYYACFCVGDAINATKRDKDKIFDLVSRFCAKEVRFEI